MTLQKHVISQTAQKRAVHTLLSSLSKSSTQPNQSHIVSTTLIITIIIMFGPYLQNFVSVTEGYMAYDHYSYNFTANRFPTPASQKLTDDELLTMAAFLFSLHMPTYYQYLYGNHATKEDCIQVDRLLTGDRILVYGYTVDVTEGLLDDYNHWFEKLSAELSDARKSDISAWKRQADELAEYQLWCNSMGNSRDGQNMRNWLNSSDDESSTKSEYIMDM